MSIRVTDPQGEMWVVSREWFAMPPGARHAVWDLPSLPDADIDAPLEDLGGLAVVVAVVTFVVILAVLTFVVMPLITIVMGLVLGVLLLLGRMVGIATWRVRAVGGERTFEWRVRGFLRGRRAIHGVARARERGGEAAVPGGAQAD